MLNLGYHIFFYFYLFMKYKKLTIESKKISVPEPMFISITLKE